MTEALPSANRQIARAAGTIMFAFALSNIVGLVRQILISDIFGTDRAIDAFYAGGRWRFGFSLYPNFYGLSGKR
jgi:hypothetical protein